MAYTYELAELLKWKCAPDYIYRQLAEECTELAKAALKIVRVQKGEASHLKEADAVKNFLEEIADVSIMIDLALEIMDDAAVDDVCDWIDNKKNRMYERLVAMPDRLETKLWGDLKKDKSAASAPKSCVCGTLSEQIQAVLNELLNRLENTTEKR